ncbi:MAG: Mov34/MPN/PAD-1 family protein [Methanospirillum sp.]|uniref:Mov34/MPN/PAD-1 family protein n=1 Tax=Methanospirillum sp. TaxID=45200 RepID=UPI0023761732|nr:Mov34/MPN/PAD-1 family protein [Methanospirillum sp.]MDD1730244.1 Mov34/MPN/PAD-1 family protein [Methanospirillum sp.]
MQVLIPSKIVHQIITALNLAKKREIGGIMMGEHIDENKFRINEITIQTHGGTLSSFIRSIKDFTEPLRSFFNRTKHEYTRFNYLGEWHSHQNFALIPSSKDTFTMEEIVMDPESNVNFAILLLVRIGQSGYLESTVTLYQPGRKNTSAEIIYE